MSRFWDALEKIEQAAQSGQPRVNLYSSTVPEQFSELPNRWEPHHEVQTNEKECPVYDIGTDSMAELRAQRFDRIVYQNDPGCAAADRFRLLRMRLRNLRANGELKSLLVTSPLPEDGKTTVALNLATALAEQSTKRVLLIEADLHSRSVTERLGVPQQNGLAEYLEDGIDPHSVVRRVEPLGWYFLSSGKRRLSNPTEVLRPQEISGLLQKLSPEYDWILVDSPPVLPVTDSLALAEAVDGTLLVTRAGRTAIKAVEDTIALLDRKHIVGLILNGMEETRHAYPKYQKYQQPSVAKSSDDVDRRRNYER